MTDMKQELKLSTRDSLLTFADDVAQQGVAVRAAEEEPERHLVIFGLDREEFAIRGRARSCGFRKSPGSPRPRRTSAES